MAKVLTVRQKEVLQFIIDYIRQQEYPPTFREIGKALNITSTKGVTDHLDVLMKKGYIDRSSNHSRAIRILKHPDTHPLSIPSGKIALVGRIAAGSPIFDEGNIEEYLDLDPMLFGRGTVFALTVSGDSMIDEHIMNGDLAIIKKQDRVENGEIAAVVVEGMQEEATLKKFYRKNDMVELVAANKSFHPITVDTRHTGVAVLGKLVGIVRKS